MSKKEKTTSSGTTTQNTTSTPTVAPWLSQGYEGLAGQIQNFAKTDPTSYVAGASPLQTQGFEQAGNLGGWSDMLGMGAKAAQAVAGAGANTAGQAQGYTPQGYTGQGYGAQMAGQTQIGAMTDAQAASLTNMDRAKYTDPFLQQVVDTTTADFNVNADRVRANQDAQMAKNRGFSGSGFGIRSAMTEGELSRALGTQQAGLRSQAFNQATAAMQADAERQQQAAMANAATRNQAALAQAQLAQQTTLSNQSAGNQAAQFGADAGNQAAQFGANAGNQAGQFNANSQNQMSQFNAGQQDSALARQLQAAGLLGQFGEAAGNQGRSDLSAILQAGGQQQAIEQSRLNALPTWLQQIGGLYGQIPIGAFTGQTSSGTGTTNSTSMTKTSDPMGALGGLASLAGTFATGIPMFGMGSQLAGAGAALGNINPALDTGFNMARFGTVGAG